MEELLQRLVHLNHWQIALTATAFLLQGAIFTIFPEELIISTLGILWSQGRIGFFESLFAVLAGLLPANLAVVFIGSKIGPRIKSRPRIEQALAAVRRYGEWLIVFTRFTPVIRGPVYLSAGLARIGLWRFFRSDASASLIQVPLLLWMGKRAGQSSHSILEAYGRIALVLVTLLGLTLLITRIWRIRRQDITAEIR